MQPPNAPSCPGELSGPAIRPTAALGSGMLACMASRGERGGSRRLLGPGLHSGRGQGRTQEKVAEETASEVPFGVWKAPDFLGWAAVQPPQFFLGLGVSYFLLLEYHSSRGIPMEGSVMTPKAAQSSCGRRRGLA